MHTRANLRFIQMIVSFVYSYPGMAVDIFVVQFMKDQACIDKYNF